jgi:hypothetical protein
MPKEKISPKYQGKPLKTLNIKQHEDPRMVLYWENKTLTIPCVFFEYILRGNHEDGHKAEQIARDLLQYVKTIEPIRAADDEGYMEQILATGVFNVTILEHDANDGHDIFGFGFSVKIHHPYLLAHSYDLDHVYLLDEQEGPYSKMDCPMPEEMADVIEDFYINYTGYDVDDVDYTEEIPLEPERMEPEFETKEGIEFISFKYRRKPGKGYEKDVVETVTSEALDIKDQIRLITEILFELHKEL